MIFRAVGALVLFVGCAPCAQAQAYGNHDGWGGQPTDDYGDAEPPRRQQQQGSGQGDWRRTPRGPDGSYPRASYPGASYTAGNNPSTYPGSEYVGGAGYPGLEQATGMIEAMRRQQGRAGARPQTNRGAGYGARGVSRVEADPTGGAKATSASNASQTRTTTQPPATAAPSAAQSCRRTYSGDPTSPQTPIAERCYAGEGLTGDAARRGDRRSYASKQACIDDIRGSDEELAKAAHEYCGDRFHQ